MTKRTSKQRHKLPPIIERYLKLLEKEVPTSQWREVLAERVTFDGGRGATIEGFDAVTRQIKEWHKVIDHIKIAMIRMTDYPGESSDKKGGRTVKVDYVVKGIWIQNPGSAGVGVEIPVMAMYEIRDGLIEEIAEAWPRGRIPPTVG